MQREVYNSTTRKSGASGSNYNLEFASATDFKLTVCFSFVFKNRSSRSSKGLGRVRAFVAGKSVAVLGLGRVERRNLGVKGG